MQKNCMKGRNVTIDRLYKFIPLAEWTLYKDMTVVGTLNKASKRITPELKSLSGREENSYIVLWETEEKQLSLHSYVVTTQSTGRRNVLLLAATNPIWGVANDSKQKPAIYNLYDQAKGSTDIANQRGTI